MCQILDTPVFILQHIDNRCVKQPSLRYLKSGWPFAYALVHKPDAENLMSGVRFADVPERENPWLKGDSMALDCVPLSIAQRAPCLDTHLGVTVPLDLKNQKFGMRSERPLIARDIEM